MQEKSLVFILGVHLTTLGVYMTITNVIINMIFRLCAFGTYPKDPSTS